MPRKALIIYASITGNTEKVAMTFKNTFERYGWECDALKITKYTNKDNLPYRMDDYDMLCAGSPVWAGVPTKEIFDDHAGVLMTPRLFREGQMFPPINQGYGPKKGIAFVTYGGDRRGTPEALVALGGLELRMEDMRIKCIGKFACPGGNKWSRIPVDTVAKVKNWTVGEAASAIARYRENPSHPEFASMSDEDKEMFSKAARQTRDLPPDPEVLGNRGMHWDVYNRPGERDLKKAEIFLEEILEDFYGGGVEAAPFGQNICIA